MCLPAQGAGCGFPTSDLERLICWLDIDRGKYFSLARLTASGPPQPLATTIKEWLLEQVPLMEAFLIAVSIHVALFPVMWFIGFALPWPKSPVITTIIEYDLGNWPEMPKPKKVFEFRDPKLNQ